MRNLDRDKSLICWVNYKGNEESNTGTISIDSVKNASLPFYAPWTASTSDVLVPYEDITTSMYVCVKSEKEAEVLSFVSDKFGNDAKT